MPKKKAKRRLVAKNDVPQFILVSRLSLKTVRAIESHSVLNLTSASDLSTIHTSISAVFGIKADGQAVGNVSVTARTPHEENKPEDASVFISVMMQCVYDIDGEPPKVLPEISEEEQKALTHMSIMLAWPYVRTHIQSVSSEMGIPTITLPLMRLEAFKDVSKK